MILGLHRKVRFNFHWNTSSPGWNDQVFSKHQDRASRVEYLKDLLVSQHLRSKQGNHSQFNLKRVCDYRNYGNYLPPNCRCHLKNEWLRGLQPCNELLSDWFDQLGCKGVLLQLNRQSLWCITANVRNQRISNSQAGERSVFTDNIPSQVLIVWDKVTSNTFRKGTSLLDSELTLPYYLYEPNSSQWLSEQQPVFEWTDRIGG
jgi:hypothetical protein